MKTIIFLTGNVRKLNEAKKIIGNEVDVNILNKKIDLDEIQSTNVKDIIEKKIVDAYKKINKPVFCEDTGLYIKNLNNFPGALIKFYYEYVGNKKITKFSGGSKAYAETIIGYTEDGKKTSFYSGIVRGTISKKPKGKKGFGWDPIFIPNNSNKTFAEMDGEEKNNISMRYKAFKKFKKFLNKKYKK